jgi:cation transport ATPase
MAEEKKKRKKKKDGRIAQMWQAYQTTKQTDRKLPWILLVTFLAPIVVVVVLATVLPGSILNWILWVVTGVLLGVLLAMIVLGRRVEKNAYQQIEGRQGAVGAVISSGLRGSYRGSQEPVAVTPRGGDAVYRVVGKGGVVLISEGHQQRVRRIVGDETRKVKRVLPNVEITVLHVGRGEGEVPLAKLSKTIKKLKRTLNRGEVQAVYQRLSSLRQSAVGIPKGVDPMRVRRPAKPR